MMKAAQNIYRIEGAASRSCSCLQEAHSHWGVINNVPQACLKRQKYEQVGFDSFDFQEQIHNSFLAPVDPNRLDTCIIQGTKVDLR